MPCPASADFLNDHFSFDPVTTAWTLLSVAEDSARPSARGGHGFTSAGGKLFVHAGWDSSGA
jgi:hypothetical protein